MCGTTFTLYYHADMPSALAVRYQTFCKKYQRPAYCSKAKVAYWRTYRSGYYAKKSGTVIKSGTVNCNVPLLDPKTKTKTYDNPKDCTSDYKMVNGVYCFKSSHLKTKTATDVVALLDMCTTPCMIDPRQLCCMVPPQIAFFFPCCREQHCCPDQQRRLVDVGATQRANQAAVSVAIAVDVEESSASKSRYVMILGCLNNDANITNANASNGAQRVIDCKVVSGH